MADEYKWGVENGELVLYPAATTDYKPTILPKWAWRSSKYANNGEVYTGYMPVEKSYPVLEPKETTYIDLLDRVRVYSPPHSLNMIFSVTEMEIPLNKPEETKYKMGSEKETSLTSINNSINEDLKKRITEIPTKSSILSEAQQNAAAIINSATHGYVTMREGENGYVEEIIISDEANYEEATNIWRWNRNGLGFTNKGWNADSYSMALTADGAIVADRITTGVMSADRIRGGNLKMGGIDYVYDENGHPVKEILYNDQRISVLQVAGNEIDGFHETREMSIGGGGIYWWDKTYQHDESLPGAPVAHIDGYSPAIDSEYPWLAVVAEDGMIINPNQLYIVQNKNDEYAYETVKDAQIFAINEIRDPETDELVNSIEVVTDVELDEDGKVKKIVKKTLGTRMYKVVQGFICTE